MIPTGKQNNNFSISTPVVPTAVNVHIQKNSVTNMNNQANKSTQRENEKFAKNDFKDIELHDLNDNLRLQF